MRLGLKLGYPAFLGVVVTVLAACGTGNTEVGLDADKAGEPAVVEEEVRSEGVLSAAEFWEAVESFPIHDTVRYAPPARSAREAMVRSELAVRGVVKGLDVVLEQETRPEFPEVSLGFITVEVEVEVEAVLSGAGVEPGDLISWRIPAWAGGLDEIGTAMRAQALPNIEAALRGGPVGARTVLFLRVHGDGQAGRTTWGALDGLISDETSIARLHVYADQMHRPADFADIEALEVAIEAAKVQTPPGP